MAPCNPVVSLSNIIHHHLGVHTGHPNTHPSMFVCFFCLSLLWNGFHFWTKCRSLVCWADLLFPLFVFDPATLIRRYHVVGVISVLSVVVLVTYVALQGTDADAFGGFHTQGAKTYSSGFYKLTGVLSFAYLIHSGCLALVRNHKNPLTITRDISIAFVLVCFTYALVGMSNCNERLWSTHFFPTSSQIESPLFRPVGCLFLPWRETVDRGEFFT